MMITFVCLVLLAVMVGFAWMIRRRLFLTPIVLPFTVAMLLLLLPRLASAHFIDGFLADCSAVGTGTCTELVATGYARQPVFFSDPVRGQAPLGSSYSFGSSSLGTIAGRAVYDAATGGNLLFVMPLAAPTVLSGFGDAGDVGSLRPTFTALIPYFYGQTFIGVAAATSPIGTMPDGSVVSSGHDLSFFRGLLLPGTLTPGA